MEPGSEDLHPLVLSQGGIYLNRAARIAQQSRPYFTNGLSPTLPRGHISQTTEHIHWKTELIPLNRKKYSVFRKLDSSNSELFGVKFWPTLGEK